MGMLQSFLKVPTANRMILFASTRKTVGAPREIQIRHVGNCLKATPAYGNVVADALGTPLSELP
jgi:catalase